MRQNNHLSGSLSIVMLGIVVAVSPLRQVYAYAPQWRPVTAIQASQAARPVVDQRFRPVNVAMSYPNQIAVSRQVVQTPVFARQYAWRPAPSSWQPKPRARVVAQQYRSLPAQTSYAVAQNDSRWRPVTMPMNPVPAMVVASAPVQQIPVANHVWRSTVQPQPVKPEQTPSRAVQQVATSQPAAYGYWPQQAANAYPQQPAWGYMPAPWPQMYRPDAMVTHMAQPVHAYMYPQAAYPAQNTYVPMPPVPFHGQSATMLRPRWVNGRMVWPQPSQNQLHQPAFSSKRRTLANVRPERICVGCGS